MKHSQIKETFLHFFKQKGHHITPPIPINHQEDKSLLFVNAGMNQFKKVFLGHVESIDKRIANIQPCLRVSGKHNDLESVGLDTYHHTFFEMLGNWSFGDYFKQEAIAWAWELITEVYQIPKKDLYVTVFEGSQQVPRDQESYQTWKKYIASERIIYASKKDNFWEMGDTGPCGPSTEIHVDIRSEKEKQSIPGYQLVNQNNPQVIEIWNLVFIAFNRLASGELMPLKEKYVDTGMGLERLAMVLQGKIATYDTDLLQPYIEYMEEVSQKVYGQDKNIDIAMRVIADHMRSIGFAIADGVLPSNTKAGYVIRRILRRAIRYAYTHLQIQEPFIYQLMEVLANEYQAAYPKITLQKEWIQDLIQKEEEVFLINLQIGLKKLIQIEEGLTNKQKRVEGRKVFELYDTHGFPVDLTQLILKEKGIEIDEEGFQKAMEEQRKRSKQASEQIEGDWVMVAKDIQQHSQFVGYGHLIAEVNIVKYKKIASKQEEIYGVVLDQTTFYPEGGGQVGDQGKLRNAHEEISIIDTQKEAGLIIHYSKKLPAALNEPLQAEVNSVRRKLASANHSATHLLYEALEELFKKSTLQKGSFISDRILRFDFLHHQTLTLKDLRRLEEWVNERIQQNLSRKVTNTSLKEAKQMGARGLEDVSYEDTVRVIHFGDRLPILCGGIHVESTLEIGYFKILKTTSVSAGVRRIEAVTSQAAYEYINDQLSELEKVQKLLKQPKNIVSSLEKLLIEKEILERKVKEHEQVVFNQLKQELKQKTKHYAKVAVCIEKIQVNSPEMIRTLCFGLKNVHEDLFLVLAGECMKKAYLGILITNNLLKTLPQNAKELVKAWLPLIQGKGGGQDFFALGSGRKTSGLDQVLKIAEAFVHQYIL